MHIDNTVQGEQLGNGMTLLKIMKSNLKMSPGDLHEDRTVPET